MTTENALIPVDESKYGSMEVFENMSSASYLSRIQLFGANSAPVQEGKFPMAHYGLVLQKDSIIDLGTSFDALIVGRRPKAMKVGAAGEKPISYYNPEDQNFIKVQQDSEIQNSGCMFGPEFLLYLPAQKKFALNFMSSKTARRASKDVHPLLGKWATFSAKLIVTSKYRWHGPTCTMCSTPYDIPSDQELNKQKLAFNNPPDEVEEVEETVADDARAR